MSTALIAAQFLRALCPCVSRRACWRLGGARRAGHRADCPHGQELLQIQPGRLQLSRSAERQAAQERRSTISSPTAPRWDCKGTELTSYYFPKEPTLEYLRHIKQLCFRLGLDVSGTAVGNDFCYPPGAQARQRNQARQTLGRLCRDPRRPGDPHFFRQAARHQRRRSPQAGRGRHRGVLPIRGRARRVSGPGEPWRTDGARPRDCWPWCAT